MNNTNASIERSSLEEYHSVDRNKNSDKIRKLSNAESAVNVTDKSMTLQRISKFRTNLFSSISAHPTMSGILGFVIFTTIFTSAGILIVCFTSPKTPSEICELTFKTVVGSTIGYYSSPRSVAIGDFNNDSWLDIAVADYGIDSVGILLGIGTGAFGTQNTYSSGTGSRPYSVAVGDLNGDHLLDIVVGNSGTNNLGVFFGRGDGTFKSQIAFSTGSSRPKSVAVGDFNNDQWLDIVVANYGTNNFGILLGLGNGSFGSPTIFSTGYDSSPYCIVVNDFNKDNHLDIAVANYGVNNLGIFIGYGNGSFAPQKTFSTGPSTRPYSIAIGDFNKDKYLDIAVVYYGISAVGIWLGAGDGTFAAQSTVTLISGSFPCSIAVGDFNRDSQLDIIVANSGMDNIAGLFGYGNGSFTMPIIYSTGSSSMPFCIAAGDFNNDNQPDIIVANSDTNNVHVLIDYVTQPSHDQTAYSTGDNSMPEAIGVADFNNDNILDVVVVNYGDDNIGIFLGYGNGSFGEQTTYSTGNQSLPVAFCIGDFNNDNQLDIVVANFYSSTLGLLYGNGSGAFESVITYHFPDFSNLNSVATGDFNHDGQQDVVVANYGTDSISTYFGNIDDNPVIGHTYSTGAGSRPYTVVVADLNNDSRLDIIVSNYGTESVGVLIGYSNGTFHSQITYSTGDSSDPRVVVIGDLNKDNRLDIAVANSGSDSIGILIGYGDGTFAKIMILSTGDGSGPYWLAIADLNNDNWLDITVANRDTDTMGVFLNHGNGTFAEQVTFPTGSDSHPLSVAIGDFNNDTLLDIVVANQVASNIVVLLGHSAAYFSIESTFYVGSSGQQIAHSNTSDLGTLFLGNYYSDFSLQTAYSTGSGTHPNSIVVGHFNSDNNPDIAVANSGNGTVGILLGYGDGSFTTETQYYLGFEFTPVQVIVGDFNRDNRTDIAAVNPSNDSISLLFGYGNGTFSVEAPISIGSGSNPQSIATGDFDQNNYLDLVVANFDTNTIAVLFGFDYSSFESQVTYSTGFYSNPTSVAIGDFNGDGRFDIVVTNGGANNLFVMLGNGDGTFASPSTYAHVIGSHPIAVAVADFNNDRHLDFAVANWGLGSISVVLGNGDGTFVTDAYYSVGSGSRPAAIGVGDFNNDSYVDIGVASFATSTISVILGYGDGSFANATMYSTGVQSGPSSITVGDINNDRHLDIVVANAVSDSVGILLGYGDGTFANVTTYTTGSDTNPQYTALGDFNKDNCLDIVVANFGTGDVGVLLGYCNGSFAPLKTYTSDSSAGTSFVCVSDFNNDNHLDIAVAILTFGSIGIFFGLGDGSFRSMVLYSTVFNSFPYSMASCDFNNDSRMDIVVVNNGLNNIGVLLGDGTKPFGGYMTLSAGDGSSPSSVAVGYFNNDKWLDIVIANSGTDNIGVTLGYGNGSFGEINTYSTGVGSQPLSIVIGDLNNDTVLDIVVANNARNNVGVLLGFADGSFGNVTKYSIETGVNPMSVAVADFDKDNCLDIAVANYDSNNVGVLTGYCNGSFKYNAVYPVGYNYGPMSVALEDFNHDGLVDIAVANYNTDNIKLLMELC